MSRRKEQVSILGSGVSGLSCALILQSLGFEVMIYTKQNDSHSNPMEVSSFPSASVIPHSVQHQDLTNLFKDSLSFFDYLHKSQFKGLTTHRHFELFTHTERTSEYVFEMSKHKVLHSFTNLPVKSGFEIQSGWEFECFFADWPIYFTELLNRFKQKGGSITIKEITKENLKDINSEVIINCSEFGSLWLFEEEFNPIIYKGHLLLVKGAPPLKDESGNTISYNLTPGSAHYSSDEGALQDVYAYPRADGWILGGSRQKGTLDREGNWVGEDSIHPLESLERQSFPAQILSLNQSILSDSFGIDLNHYKDRELRIGYRFMGNGKEGLRLDSEEKFNRLIIHNYGHGGAGVTISWGCAFRVASLFIEKLGYQFPTKEALFEELTSDHF